MLQAGARRCNMFRGLLARDRTIILIATKSKILFVYVTGQVEMTII
jgi:hypothetical protein